MLVERWTQADRRVEQYEYGVGGFIRRQISTLGRLS
jgi:hypothetical protein